MVLIQAEDSELPAQNIGAADIDRMKMPKAAKGFNLSSTH
jgi:hypothetical protein